MSSTFILAVGFTIWAVTITWATIAANDRCDKLEKNAKEFDLDLQQINQVNHKVESNHEVFLATNRATVKALGSAGERFENLQKQLNEMPKESIFNIPPIKLEVSYTPPKNLGGKGKRK